MCETPAWLSVLAAASLAACGEAPPPPAPPAQAAIAAVDPPATSAPPLQAAPLAGDELHLALAAVNGPLPHLTRRDHERVLADARAAIDKLLPKARTEDRELLKKGAVILHELEAYDGVAQLDLGVFDRIVALDRAWIALYPDDAGAKLWLAKTLSDISTVVVFSGFDQARKDAQIAEGNAIVRDLAERFPDDARVQAERAEVCVSEQGDGADCMRRFARCLALDPGMRGCAERLEWVKRRYLAPYCAPADVKPGFVVRIAEARDRKVGREPLPLSKLLLGPPVLNAADVDEIASVPSDSGPAWVRIGIARGGRRDAKGAAEAVAKRTGMLFALMDGATLLGTASAAYVRTDGSALDWMQGASLERVCKKPSRRELPADLQAGPRSSP